MTRYYTPHRKKEPSPQDRMLADFLRAPTAEQKRKVIEQFAPLYFALTPQPTKENQNEQVEV
jgi:hypothetical protein